MIETKTRKLISKVVTCKWGERREALEMLELEGYTLVSSEVVAGEDYDVILTAEREIK